MSPLEAGPIYAPGAGPPHPEVERRRVAQSQASAAAAVAALPSHPPYPGQAVEPAYPGQRAYPAPPSAPPAEPVRPVQPTRAPAVEHRRRDWVIGIVLGIVLGLAVAAGFVFIGSEDTVDAPRIHGIDTGGPGAKQGGPKPEPERLSGQ